MSLHLSSNKNYTDMSGNSRTFDIVDHDVKTSIGTDKLTEEQLKALREKIGLDKVMKVKALFALPAISIREINPMLTKIENGKIVWDMKAAAEAFLIDELLLYNTFNFAWKNTIAETYWDVDLTYKEIIDGKWQEYVPTIMY